MVIMIMLLVVFLCSFNVGAYADVMANFLPEYKANNAYMQQDFGAAEKQYVKILGRNPYDPLSM